MTQQAKRRMSNDNFIQIQDLWKVILRRWRWFAFSIIISLGIAILYIAQTTPVYLRSTSLLIKDDGKNIGGDNNTLYNLDVFKTNTNINNEMLTLRSAALMKEVVKKLSLDISYSTRNGIQHKILYRKTPIKVIFAAKDDNRSISFNVELFGDSIRISDFRDQGEKLSESTIKGKLSQSIKTPIGSINIRSTDFYSNYAEGTNISVNKKPSDVVSSHYSSLLKVDLGNEEATIVDLSITDESVNRAEDILNTLIESYNENWIEDKNQIAVSTSEFINKRLAVIENELGNVDDNISTFKSKNLLPDIQATTSMYLAQSNDNNTKILALNNQLSVAQFIKSHISEHPKHQLIPANLGLESFNTESLIGEYNGIVLKRNNLLNNSSEKNPLLKDLDESLNTLRQSILSSVDNLIGSFKLQINNIRKSENQTNQQIASNPNQAKYLLSVERQQKVKESLYLYLLQKREENQLSQAFTAYNSRIINPPSGNMIPVSPQKSKIVLLALIIGFIIPLLIILLLNSLDISVRGKKDLKFLSIPFIGEIPLFANNDGYTFIRRHCIFKKNKKQKDKLQIVVEERNRNSINEAFRVIRTNLDFISGNSDKAKIIMFSSFNSNCGKTFISANLGISLTLAKKKVVIIDLDMRKADLSRNTMGVDYGVSDYLGGFIDDPEKIIVGNMGHSQTDIIPVGTIPPNPTELLLSERLSSLLQYLRTKYDYILIDCPPIDIVADSSIIEKQADLTIFVIRTGSLDRRMLPELEDIYQSKRFGNMVMILNGTAISRSKYGYYYE